MNPRLPTVTRVPPMKATKNATIGHTASLPDMPLADESDCVIA